MRKNMFLFIAIFVSTSIQGQAPSTFSFQAVIRDANNQVVANSPIGMRTAILQGTEDGTIIYQEIYHPNPVTNANGLITLEVGNGLILTGDFNAIDWSDGPYFIQTEADPTGGTNYTITGSVQLMSVPYALHAQTADGLSFDFVEEDPVFMESPASGILSGDIESWDAAYDWGDHGVEGYLLEEVQSLADVLIIGNDAAGMRIKNLPEPEDDSDAATKSYVDELKKLVQELLIHTGLFIQDIDGNLYRTVTIGSQVWMAENLRVSKYNNGVAIPTGLTNAQWSSTWAGAYAIYNNDESLLEAYGKLYNWRAVKDLRGLCPEGWKVPGDADWTQLVNYLVSQGFPNEWNNPNGAGNALKSCRQINSPLGGDCDTSDHPRWNSHNINWGFDQFGFSALPGGRRDNNGHFTAIGDQGRWWSSTQFSSTEARLRYMHISRGDAVSWTSDNREGYSVRCIKE